MILLWKLANKGFSIRINIQHYVNLVNQSYSLAFKSTKQDK